VRWFITAGTADQEVPDKSAFCRAFVDALRGLAPNEGGVLTGEELALYIKKKVIQERGRLQTPRFGSLGLNPRRGQGSIMFRVPQRSGLNFVSESGGDGSP
jgi:hypothetical protein